MSDPMSSTTPKRVEEMLFERLQALAKSGISPAQLAKAGGVLTPPQLAELDALAHGKKVRDINNPKPNGLKHPNGAPELDDPKYMTGDQMAIAIASLQVKLEQTLATTSRENVQLSSVQRKTLSDSVIKKLATAIKKLKAAHQKRNSALGWATKVLTLVGAAIAVVAATLLTAATGGAAAPLLALAVMGMAAAVVDFASQIASEEFGKSTFTIGSGIADAFKAMGASSDTSKLLAAAALGPAGFILSPDAFVEAVGVVAKKAGASEQQIADIKLAATIFVMVADLVASIAAGNAAGGGAAAAKGAGSAAGAAEAAGEAADAGKQVKLLNQVSKAAKEANSARMIATGADSAQQLTSAGLAGAESGEQIDQAQAKHDSELSRSDAEKLNAQKEAVQAVLDAAIQTLQEITLRIQDEMSEVVRMLAGNATSQESQARII